MSEQKWWLISDEDVQIIRKSLIAQEFMITKTALHTLESGLHMTECIPDDYKEKTQ